MVRKLIYMAVCLAGGLMLSAQASAFCIDNKSKVPVHVLALDGSGYVSDIPPGKSACRKASKPTRFMAVTDYRPAGKSRHAGWRAECRAVVSGKGHMIVQGNHKKISCKAK